MFLVTFLTLVTLVIFLDYLNKKRRNEISSGIPGPLQIPIFGNYYVFTIRKTKDVVDLMTRHAKLYNGFSRAWIFNKLSINISRPDYLESIMNSSKHIKKSTVYDALKVWLGDGLLVSAGQKWHSRRKVITPAFHFKILEQFVEVFDRQSSVLVKQMGKHSGSDDAFNVYPYITLATLDVISETAMGVKINAQTDSNCKYARAVSDITETMMYRLTNNFLHNDFLFAVFAPSRKRMLDQALKELHSFANTVIRKRRAALEMESKQTNTRDNQDEDIGAKKKMAFLDILLRSTANGKALSDADIREEVDTFMFEGHDTTTSGISFTLYLISRHPDIQEKLFQEIRQVFGADKSKSIEHNDLQELKYLERVIKESMRLFPPVAIVAREVTEDTTIDGYHIPAGSELVAPLFIMMKNPKFFPNPEKFDPDRHTIENSTEKVNPYVYIPFSAGPRNCIGQKFAMLEMKTMIAKIMRHYELLPLGDAPNPTINIVTKSTNGVHIGIRERRY